MKTYCVKQKKETLNVPGSERIMTTSNGRRMMASVCAECGATKTQFVKSTTGGLLNPEIGKRYKKIMKESLAGISDFSCAYNLKGKRPGTVEECFKKGQIRRYGVKALDDGLLDDLIANRASERKQKARARRPPAKPRVKKPPGPKTASMSREKQKEYIDEIVADIKGENKRPIPSLPLALPPPPTSSRKNEPRKLDLAPKYEKQMKDAVENKLKDTVLLNLIDNRNKINYLGDIVIEKISAKRYRIKDLDDPMDKGTKMSKSEAIDRLRELTEFDEKYSVLVDEMVGDFLRNNSEEVKKMAIREYLVIKQRLRREILEKASRLAKAKKSV